MLKSSSLCLYSSNLGTFWLKIKQFWPFEEISIFSNGSHLGWMAWLSNITFKGNPLRMIQAKFGLNWPSDFRGEDFWKSLQTDDGRQVMAIAHTGELKMGIIINDHTKISPKYVKNRVRYSSQLCVFKSCFLYMKWQNLKNSLYSLIHI